MQDALQLAEQAGFDQFAAITVDDIVTDKLLSMSCSPTSCKKYASCWSCPPGSGTFEEQQEHFVGKSGGVIVQTIRDDVDIYEDYEQLAEIRKQHNDKLDWLASELRKEFQEVLEFSTGGCDLCSPCTYPDAPCQRPIEQRLSLSAHGVAVGTTCKNAGLDYSFENGRVRFVGIILHS